MRYQLKGVDLGPYVTDGKKNASLKGYVVDEVTLDQAVQLIDEKS